MSFKAWRSNLFRFLPSSRHNFCLPTSPLNRMESSTQNPTADKPDGFSWSLRLKSNFEMSNFSTGKVRCPVVSMKPRPTEPRTPRIDEALRSWASKPWEKPSFPSPSLSEEHVNPGPLKIQEHVDRQKIRKSAVAVMRMFKNNADVYDIWYAGFFVLFTGTVVCQDHHIHIHSCILRKTCLRAHLGTLGNTATLLTFRSFHEMPAPDSAKCMSQLLQHCFNTQDWRYLDTHRCFAPRQHVVILWPGSLLIVLEVLHDVTSIVVQSCTIWQKITHLEV